MIATSSRRGLARLRGFAPQPWKQARPDVRVKLLAQDAELYVFAESRDRIAKERGMRRRQMKWLWARLRQLSTMKLTRDALLMKLGAAQDKTACCLAARHRRARNRRRLLRLLAQPQTTARSTPPRRPSAIDSNTSLPA